MTGPVDVFTGRELFRFSERERFAHGEGWGFRTEVDVADGVRGYWVIEDLDGNDICSVQRHPDGWKTCTPLAGIPAGKWERFDDAVDAHVRAIASTGGEQTDELFWMGGGLPRWR